MGKHHVRNYSNLPHANLVAICDVQQVVLDEFCSQYNCNGYTDLNEMLDKEKIDAISITAPTRFHYPIAITIIERGINLLIEKIK